MTKHGAGTSGYFGEIRHRGAKFGTNGVSEGVMPWLRIFDVVSSSISQGSTRRGSFAAYLPVDHPDILEFLTIRDDDSPLQKIQFAVTIPDSFMCEVEKGKNGNPKCLQIWSKILEKRSRTGFPYIMFSDNVNASKPQIYKDKNMTIYSSNLCAEIALSSNAKESFVCCLASVNLLHYDEWKNTDLIETVTYFLDSVMTEYINKTEGMPFMEDANRFAKNQRALGLGVLGWHSYLQRNMIPFESLKAKIKNKEIFKLINERSLKASKELAVMFGEPELCKGYGVRNVTRCAIAPTTSSSFILGQVSPSIEPLNSNYYVKDLAKGVYSYRNEFLEELLEEKGMNTMEVWKDILVHGGSVMHLSFLTDEEKAVFKTFGEISQKEIILQAAQRQPEIDQAQSINIMIPPNVHPKEINKLMIEAWKMGIKTLYYQRSANPAQELARSIMTCTSCQA